MSFAGVLRSSTVRQTAGASVAVGLFFIAIWVLGREVAGIRLADVLHRAAALPREAIVAAVAFVATSYLALAGYDWLALRHIGRRLPMADVARYSFVATAVGHNLGMAMLSGGAIRYRLYSAAGLSAAEIAAVVGMVGVTFGIGVMFVLSLILLFAPTTASAVLRLSPAILQVMGAAMLLAAVLYVVWGAVRKGPVRLRHWQFTLPDASTALLQLAFAAVDIACAGAVLFMLLPADVHVGFAHFLCVYALAIAAGVISHVPGGLGVFESVLLLALPALPKDGLLGAIFAYRLLYYLAPLMLALVLGLATELARGGPRVNQGLRLATSLAGRASPQLLAAVTFVLGAVLVFSGATPGFGERMDLLDIFVPLAVVELSHMAASFAGVALMLLAHSLYRRVNAAYQVSFWMLVVAIVGSLVKGLDYEEALLAALVLGALYLGRAGFHRRASILEAQWSSSWIALVLIAVVGSLWLGLFAYQHVSYSNELWWRFAMDADAPRFLRATLVVVLTGTGFALMRLFSPHVPVPGLPDRSALATAERISHAVPHSDSALALLGDKCLMFNEAEDGFVMYRVRGGSWIAMGDPVGPEGEIESLAWKFRELSDRHGGRTIFYQVDADNLAIYVDMGLGLLKLGEEALIPLENFSLAGSARADLRQAHRRIEREGASFEIVPPGEVVNHLPRLRAISDEWLVAKGTREKGFSLGRFDEAYIASCHCALIRVGGQIVAFANLWTGDGKTEVSVDLMRYANAAPKGTMDYLFAELFLWGASQGYRHFNLGMAPLSGLETHPLAPLWHRIGTLVYRHGEHFYNFEGLRAYKAKFKPEWKPKYLAAPRGLGLPTVLLDVSALISGGFKGLLGR